MIHTIGSSILLICTSRSSLLTCILRFFLQNAFVICRLFKKQDETIEDINGGEVDPSVLSPTEDMVSELEVPQDCPTVKQEADKASDTNETCLASLADEVISNAVDNHDNYNEMDQVAEIDPAEVRERENCILI